MSVRAPSADSDVALNVAATYTVLGFSLPYHIDRVSRMLPKLEIRLFEMAREPIEEGLLSNRYDIAVFLTLNNVNPDLAAETLLSSKRRLWLSSKHRLLSRDNVELKEIADEPCIMLSVDEAAHTRFSTGVRLPIGRE
ncbi:LysR substrate-binding domain-containing protein [Rhizobium leguminosarum]|uniref:LysR substrate-binding domain-containing protein n=1 Tax=Rhizobium leguminosarum TaxID=384 RepID=UPI0021B1504C|nr:LysR substrate-binding domain-containing protein [Rhizobium leguminosarum]